MLCGMSVSPAVAQGPVSAVGADRGPAQPILPLQINTLIHKFHYQTLARRAGKDPDPLLTPYGQGFQGAPPLCYLEEIQAFATI